MNGYGWCLLRAEIPDPTERSDDELDERLDALNKDLWKQFQRWMSENPSGWLRWQFHEYNNNDSGVLTFSVSRNHRSSVVWDMLTWIAANGPGSYGLFYAHDDEDQDRQSGKDQSNVFRVHRLLHGQLTEHSDPFFGEISPSIERW